MTKEELKQEARQKSLEWNGEKINGKYNRPPIANWSCYEKGYLAGAEPREKRIAELEAEVKEWKDKADLWCKTANLKNHNIMINKELEKENAELKESLKKWKDAIYADVENYDEQLTKATKIIKELCGMVRELNKPNVQLTNVDYSLSEAEQFISEVEK